jgi:hypothetical protein
VKHILNLGQDVHCNQNASSILQIYQLLAWERTKGPNAIKSNQFGVMIYVPAPPLIEESVRSIRAEEENYEIP